MYKKAILKILLKSDENGLAIVLTRMLTDRRRRQTTDIMITIPLLPRGKKRLAEGPLSATDLKGPWHGPSVPGG